MHLRNNKQSQSAALADLQLEVKEIVMYQIHILSQVACLLSTLMNLILRLQYLTRYAHLNGMNSYYLGSVGFLFVECFCVRGVNLNHYIILRQSSGSISMNMQNHTGFWMHCIKILNP